MRMLVCSDCNTHSVIDWETVPVDSPHVGHRAVVIAGDDLDELARVAVKHLRITGTVMPAVREGRY